MAKMVVECISAWQLTGPRTIGQLLLLEKGHRQKRFAEQPLTFEQPLLFHRAKMVLQCISARQLTGPRAIGQQLLLKKGHRKKRFAEQPLTFDTPKNFMKICP